MLAVVLSSGQTAPSFTHSVKSVQHIGRPASSLGRRRHLAVDLVPNRLDQQTLLRMPRHDQRLIRRLEDELAAIEPARRPCAFRRRDRKNTYPRARVGSSSRRIPAASRGPPAAWACNSGSNSEREQMRMASVNSRLRGMRNPPDGAGFEESAKPPSGPRRRLPSGQWRRKIGRRSRTFAIDVVAKEKAGIRLVSNGGRAGHAFCQRPAA